jgi:hypothetical protein
MKFCSFCGSTLNDNEVCSCQQTPAAQTETPERFAQAQMPPLPGANTQPANPPIYPQTSPYLQPPPYPPPLPQYGYPPPGYPPPGYPPPGYKVVEPGRKMMKVSAILMVVMGGYGFLFSIPLRNSWSVALKNFGFLFSYDFIPPIVFAAAIMLLSIVFGILGIAYSKNPNKAGSVIVMGIVLLFLQVVCILWGAFGITRDINILYGSFIFEIGMMLDTIVLPILYIVGGNKRRKSAN